MSPGPHLSALALDAALLDEPLPAAAVAHLQACVTCSDRVEAARAFDAGLALRPPAATYSAVQAATPAVATVADAPAAPATDAPAAGAVVLPFDLRRHRTRRVVGVASALFAAAAVWLLIARAPGPSGDGGESLDTAAAPHDRLRARGAEGLAAFDVAFFVHDGGQGPAAVRRVGDGDAVASGERLRARLTLPGHAFVAILGVDAAGTTYRCHPQGAGDELAEHHGAGAPAGAAEVAIEDTVAFDEAPGEERVVALACPGSASLSSLEAALAAAAKATGPHAPLPPLREGCAQREVRLRKRSGP